jgi:general secretion pathway protein H
MRARHNRGFTLIELLAVIVIVAVVSATVVLGMFGAERDHELRAEAMRLAQLIELARDEAVLRNRELGLQVTPDGYRFLVFDPQAQRWEVFERHPFQPRALPRQLGLAVDVEQRLRPTGGARAQQQEPQIVIFSSGEQTPFVIELMAPPEWQTPSWFVRSDGLSRTAAARAGAEHRA